MKQLKIKTIISFIPVCCSSHPRETNIVENLQPDETYYWKLMAVEENGINSESVVQSFITGE